MLPGLGATAQLEIEVCDVEVGLFPQRTYGQRLLEVFQRIVVASHHVADEAEIVEQQGVAGFQVHRLMELLERPVVVLLAVELLSLAVQIVGTRGGGARRGG